MTESMNAAVMYGPGDVRFGDVPRPACPEGGFVLKVEAVGLCGSDIRNLTTDSRSGQYPFIYGHEVVGRVVETDTTEELYQVGRLLYVYPEAACLKCEFCRSGHSEQCINVEHYTEHPGGFAQYITYTRSRVERGAVYPIPEGADPVLATLAEPLSSTYACIENVGVGLHDTVAIIGAGPIGIMLAVLSKMRGARSVIIVDVTQARLDKAGSFGVDNVVNARTSDPVQEVLRLTGGGGASIVISANPSTEAQGEALLMARPTGTVVFFGGVAKGALSELDTNIIHYRSLWVYGHYGANSMQVQRAFELSLDSRFPTRQILTHILPLSEINEAVELTRSGEAIKVALLPNERSQDV